MERKKRFAEPPARRLAAAYQLWRFKSSLPVGGRDSEYAVAFMDDVANRLANRVQMTTDGHKAYFEAVEGVFGADVDYA